MPLEVIVKGQLISIPDSERQPCEIWSRVMGYFRPVQDWNFGKKSEHAVRKWFKESKVMIHVDSSRAE
jgi:anaerobic ribonucleoside-triphosphate reductase